MKEFFRQLPALVGGILFLTVGKWLIFLPFKLAILLALWLVRSLVG